MPETAYPVTMHRLRQTSGGLIGRGVSSTAWETVARFEGVPPSTARWSVACNFDADATDGTVGEIRLRTTDSAGGQWFTDPVAVNGPVQSGQTRWVEVQGQDGPQNPVAQELQARRLSGDGSVRIRSARSLWLSAPLAASSQATGAIQPVASTFVWGANAQTVANPGSGNGGTIILGVVAPGPGFDNETTGSFGWVDPVGATLEADYETQDPGGLFTQRVRLWSVADTGQADFTMGFVNEATDPAFTTQTVFAIALSGTAPFLNLVGPIIEAGGGSDVVPYPVASGGNQYTVLALATSQNDDEVTAGPDGAGVWTELLNNTDGSGPNTFGGTPNRRLARIDWASINTGTIDPGNSTWVGTAASHVTFTVAIPPSSGSAGETQFTPLPGSSFSYQMDPVDQATWYPPIRQTLIAGGNRFQIGATADDLGPTLTGPPGPTPASGDRGGYDLTFDGTLEVHSFPMDGGTETLRYGRVTRDGRQVLRTQFVFDPTAGFDNANTSGAFNLAESRPPSDPSYFGGHRTQKALLLGSDFVEVGANADEVVMCGAYHVEPWMIGDAANPTRLTGPAEIHAPNGATLGYPSPIYMSWEAGAIQLIQRGGGAELQWNVQVPANGSTLFSYPLAGLSGRLLAWVLRTRIDPLDEGPGPLVQLWIGLDGGPLQQVFEQTTPYGYKLNNGSGVNALFFPQVEQVYLYHWPRADGPANNWTDTTASGNVVGADFAYSAVAQLNPVESNAEFAEHLRHILNR